MEKLWLFRNVVLNIGEKTPLFMKNEHFGGGVGFPAGFLWAQNGFTESETMRCV